MGFFHHRILSGCVLVIVFLSGSFSQGAIPSTAGLELGGNGSMLITDPTVQAFGVGAGSQGSLFLTMWTDHKIAGKMRLETISMRQEAIQKSSTNYVLPGSSLKSLTQNWNLISFGAQGNFPSQGQTFFWEALLGYAIGAPSTVTVTMAAPDTALADVGQNTSSGFILSGGVGIKRVFSQYITGLVDIRTQFFLGPTYSSGSLASKCLIPVPVSFNVGVEIPFVF